MSDDNSLRPPFQPDLEQVGLNYLELRVSPSYNHGVIIVMKCALEIVRSKYCREFLNG